MPDFFVFPDEVDGPDEILSDQLRLATGEGGDTSCDDVWFKVSS